MISFCKRICRAANSLDSLNNDLKLDYTSLQNTYDVALVWLDLITKAKKQGPSFWQDVLSVIDALDDNLDLVKARHIKNHQEKFRSRLNAFDEDDAKLLDVNDEFFKTYFTVVKARPEILKNILQTEKIYQEYLKSEPENSSKNLQDIISEQLGQNINKEELDCIKSLYCAKQKNMLFTSSYVNSVSKNTYELSL